MTWDIEQIALDDEVRFQTFNGLWTGKKPPFVKVGVIRNTNFTESGRVDYSNVAWLQVEERQLVKRQLQPGDIIVERSGGGPKQPVGRVVYFARADGPFSFSNFTSTIRVRDVLTFDAKFVFYCLLEMYQSGKTEDLQRRTTGIRNLDFTAYKERASFPKLPLPEQKNIAAVLGVVQRAMEQQERLLALTTELKMTLLHKLFTAGLHGEPQKQTDLGTVPESWEVAKIGDIAKLQSGGTPARDVPEYWQEGTIPWVKTGEIDYGIICGTEEHITQEGMENSAAKLFPRGTLLMAMYGQGVTRGRVAMLGIDSTTNQACAAITPRDESLVSSRFLYHYMEYHYEELRQLGHGANQRNMNAALIRGFPVAFPKKTEQQEIVSTLSVLDAKASIHQRKHATLSALFRTLLHQLMAAQIRVNQFDFPEVQQGGR